MKLIRRMLYGMVLCGACCNLADGQNAERRLAESSFPSSSNLLSDQPFARLARLPATTPAGLPGANAFADWHRADLVFAADSEDDGFWSFHRATTLEPWRLMTESARGWSVTGLLEAGATVNVDNPASRFNGPLKFNDRTDFPVNQLYVSVQRSPRRQGGRFDWASRVDLLCGTDYVFVQSVGWETQPDGDNALNGVTTGNRNPDLYGLAIPQAYVELSSGRFDLKLGHFYTIVGYEGVAANANFFYSHSHALQYGEPLTHSGGLLRWTGERLTVQGGVVNGWDRTDGVNDDAAFLGGVAWANRRSSLGISFISGNEDGVAGTGRRTMYSLVWQAAVNDRLAYVLQHDFACQQDSLAAGVDARWYGITQYLFYAVSDTWKLGARYEWFHDDGGTRLAGMYARNGGLGLPPAGFAGAYYNATLGANWTPNANLSVRPEIRWDWSAGTGLAPFADFTSDSQLTLAVDAVYIF